MKSITGERKGMEKEEDGRFSMDADATSILTCVWLKAGKGPGRGSNQEIRLRSLKG